MTTHGTTTRLSLPTPARAAALALLGRRAASLAARHRAAPMIEWPLARQVIVRTSPHPPARLAAGLVQRRRVAPGAPPFGFQPLYAPAWARRAGWRLAAPARTSRDTPLIGASTAQASGAGAFPAPSSVDTGGAPLSRARDETSRPAEGLRRSLLLDTLLHRAALAPLVHDIRSSAPAIGARRVDRQTDTTLPGKPAGMPAAVVRALAPGRSLRTQSIDLAPVSTQAAPDQRTMQDDREQASAPSEAMPAARASGSFQLYGDQRLDRDMVGSPAASPIATAHIPDREPFDALPLDPSIAVLPRRGYRVHAAPRLPLLAHILHEYAPPGAEWSNGAAANLQSTARYARPRTGGALQRELIAARHPRLIPARRDDGGERRTEADGSAITTALHQPADRPIGPHHAAQSGDLSAGSDHAIQTGGQTLQAANRRVEQPAARPIGPHRAAQAADQTPQVANHRIGRIGLPSPSTALPLLPPFYVRSLALSAQRSLLDDLRPREGVTPLRAGAQRARLERIGWRFRAAQDSGDEPPEPQRLAATARHLMHQGGESLPEQPRAALERALGVSFGGARIHAGPEAAALAGALRADAVTVGDVIFFGTGKTRFDTREGLALLGHELTHVAQARGVRPSPVPAHSPRFPTETTPTPGNPQQDESEALHVERVLRAMLAPARPNLSLLAAPRHAVAPLDAVGLPARGALPAATSYGPAVAPGSAVALAGMPAAASDRSLGERGEPAAPADPGPTPDQPNLDALAQEVYDRLRSRLLIERERRGW